MSARAAETLPAVRARVSQRELALTVTVPVLLYAVAVAARAWAAGLVDFPANEGSAYYVAVAENLVAGRGLVIDALWSYATPPLELPRPAFELWQPLASFIAAAAMLGSGPGFEGAQLGSVLVGALLAPLGGLVALDAASALGVADRRRRQWLAVGSGLLVAVSAPLLTATALPDSTMPFTVAAVSAALLLSRALAVGRASSLRPALLVGVALGIAWLARHEAVWLGLVALVLAGWAGRLDRRFAIALVVGGLVVVTPWLVRNELTFGTPLPGQTTENALLTSNEQIFAFTARPHLDGFLAQGLDRIAANVADAALHNVLVVFAPAAPAIVCGLLAGAWLLRRGPLRVSALGALLLFGLVTFAATTLLFPVATRWGTFEHGAGPIVVGLSVAAVIGVERAIVLVGARRRWRRNNSWLAGLALVGLSLPLSLVVVRGLAVEADRLAEQSAVIAAAVEAQPEAAHGAVIVTDHPIWLSRATGNAAIALPAEPLASLRALVDRFGATLVVLSGARGEYPALLREPGARACFDDRTPSAAQAAAAATGVEWPPEAAIFAVREACR